MVRGSFSLIVVAVVGAGVLCVAAGCQSTPVASPAPAKGLATPLGAKAGADTQQKAVEADRFPTAKQAGL